MGYLITFDEFWEIYDKKVGRFKCEEKFSKLKDKDLIHISEHIVAYVESTPEKQYRKNPLSYLNQHTWEDEIIFTKEQIKKPCKKTFLDKV